MEYIQYIPVKPALHPLRGRVRLHVGLARVPARRRVGCGRPRVRARLRLGRARVRARRRVGRAPRLPPACVRQVARAPQKQLACVQGGPPHRRLLCWHEVDHARIHCRHGGNAQLLHGARNKKIILLVLLQKGEIAQEHTVVGVIGS